MLSVTGVLAAVVFSTSVDHLRAEPDLYGWGFDAVVEGVDLSGPVEPIEENDDPNLAPELDADPDVIDRSVLYTQLPITLDGEPTFATAVVDPAESLDPVVVRGDAPRGADELALGGDTLASIGADVGDTIEVSLGEDPHQMRIIGIVALPVPGRRRAPPRPAPSSARPAW